MAMDLGLLYDFDLSFIPQSFLAAMGDSQTDLFSGDADMELLDKLETWSQNIQPISFHRTYNHYPWQVFMIILDKSAMKLNNYLGAI